MAGTNEQEENGNRADVCAFKSRFFLGWSEVVIAEVVTNTTQTDQDFCAGPLGASV